MGTNNNPLGARLGVALIASPTSFIVFYSNGTRVDTPPSHKASSIPIRLPSRSPGLGFVRQFIFIHVGTHASLPSFFWLIRAHLSTHLSPPPIAYHKIPSSVPLLNTFQSPIFALGVLGRELTHRYLLTFCIYPHLATLYQ